MTVRRVVAHFASVAFGATLAVCFAAGPALAGTTGKLTGTVLDAKKQPLVGANVALTDARLGAVTDDHGRYVVFNVPAGSHVVRVSLIGYAATTVNAVSISADHTTTLDVTLQESAVQVQEVVVTARRPVVDLGLTSNVATITRDEIAKLPVQELADVVNLQAGVVDGHFRGGRAGEVQYQVDGVTVNNPYDNTSTVRLDRSILEEVQVISGTFDAEYGQAMSGVVNAVLRRGTEHWTWSGELLSGGFLYQGDRRPAAQSFQPLDIQNYQFTASGPTGLPKTLFLVSGRRGIRDDFVRGRRLFRPTDRPDSNQVITATGDRENVTLGYSREWTGIAKLTNRSLPNVEIGYQAIVNSIRARKGDWAYRFDPDGLSRQRTFSIVHGFDWTQAIGAMTVLKLDLRQNFFDYRDMLYDRVDDPRYQAAGPATGYDVFENGAIIYGVQNTRFIQRTNLLVIGGALTRHLSRDHTVKGGIEWQPTRLTFGSPGHLSISGEQFAEHVDQPPDYPAPAHYNPVIGAAYAQDDLEWNDLRFRAGLRYEYFNPKAGLPSDLANPANAISGAPLSHFQSATRKMTIAPRLGVSYPVTSKSSLFFAYGHFYQMPLLGDMFRNADYTVLANLQADGLEPGVLGNPDVRPEKTVQYQFGYKHQIREWLGLDVTLFYKDIRDLLGVQVLTTYNNAIYRRLANTDFGNVIGMTLALDQRAVGPVSTSLDYTWQVAKGSASDPYEVAARIDAGEDPRPRQTPLNWDQRHTVNLTVTLARPDVYNVSAAVRAASGQPYTPVVGTGGFGGGLEFNSGRKPSGLLIDLRAEKRLQAARLRWSVFGRAFNLLDTRFFNGFVFGNTGSPYYSRFTSTDARLLADPTRFYAPRRVELGITWEGGTP